MECLNIDFLGIGELHWIGDGYFTSNEFTIYFSGYDIRRNGVEFIASKGIARAVRSFRAINVRVMSIRISVNQERSLSYRYMLPLRTQPRWISRNSTPISKKPLRSRRKEISSSLSMGKFDLHFNAKVGAQEEPQITGKIKLGEQNDAVVEFCYENRLTAMDSWFRQAETSSVHLDVSH
ncbi:craniofacial development protein 2-like [Centruroides vittatus]|uniref:craniofacial development protein 2-like n=1 Tax=Centruroides vittatus TaxID=120091 RepID=UPI00350F134E